MKKVLSTLLNTALLVTIMGAAAFLVAPRFGLMSPYEIKIVRSGSMDPAIKTGSVVLIHPEASYAVGDVITFGKDTRTSIPTTHRVIETHTEGGTTYLSTKGDANEDPDAVITPTSAVIGKVLLTVPMLGYIFAFAKTTLGFMMLIAIPAGLIMLYEVIGIYTEVKAMRRRKKDDRALRELAHEAPKPFAKTTSTAATQTVSRILSFDIETPYRTRRYRTL